MTGYNILALLIALLLALILVGGLIFFFKYRRKQGEPTKPDGQLRH
jgi:Tfp pilus assembly protein PilW